ncbi:hypothetical protein ACG83_16370 [Frankia sp. R43]|nr:hypothetical protein ACG83_16370 [Frankia sp. R43]
MSTAKSGAGGEPTPAPGADTGPGSPAAPPGLGAALVVFMAAFAAGERSPAAFAAGERSPAAGG